MITEKLKELATLRRQAAALETEIAADRTKELAALPGRFGFPDGDSFIAALRAAIGARGSRGRPRKPRAAAAGKERSARRRTRAKITDEIRAQVKKLVEAEKTAPEIAKTVGVSIPSVHNIKKSLGLVRKRKK